MGPPGLSLPPLCFRSYRNSDPVCFPPLLFYSYLAEQCWRGGSISFIMLRHVKQKAPLPPPPPHPCRVIGISGEAKQHDRAPAEASGDGPSSPCNSTSQDSELQSSSSLCSSSSSLDPCEKSGPSPALTKQNPDKFCKDGAAPPACLLLESQTSSLHQVRHHRSWVSYFYFEEKEQF